MSGRVLHLLPNGWERHVSDWVLWLVAAGRSRETVRVRAATVRKIARDSGTRSPQEMTGEWLVAYCAAQPWSTDHRRTVRASLNGFYVWLGQGNPAAVLPAAPMSRPAPRPVTDPAWDGLLAAADPATALMARLAAEAGLRRAEVARVHSDDVVADVAGYSLRVHGKGARERIVPLNEALAAELLDRSGWVFPNRCGGHLSADCVGRRVSGLLPPGQTMHKLRHRFASRGYAGTHDLVAVQRALGHASLATTQRYVASDDAAMRRVAAAAQNTPPQKTAGGGVGLLGA